MISPQGLCEHSGGEEKNCLSTGNLGPASQPTPNHDQVFVAHYEYTITFDKV